MFQKIPSCKIIELGDNRFKYFSEKLIPGLIKKSNVAIVFPEYVDFVRVKEYLDLINIEYESICEYDTKADVDRARHYFKDEGNILLYTERAHFFRRYRIPSVLHIVFYQPLNFGFYPELVNQVSQDGTCTTLLSIYDQHALERTIGSEKCKIVLKSEKEAFMFTL